MKYRIAPSILSADFARLGEDVAKVVAAGADLIHVDVMDNHYVPNLTFGPLICSALRQYGIQTPFDVHLMVQPVDSLIPAFAKAGANFITFHPEASLHVHRTIQLIHDNGARAGLALNPATPLSVLDHVLPELDQVLIMSVNPGFGGQSFIPSALDKIKQLKKRIEDDKLQVHIEVDGGVKIDNIADIALAGADTFVAGSAIFGTPDYRSTIEQMREKLRGVGDE